MFLICLSCWRVLILMLFILTTLLSNHYSVLKIHICFWQRYHIRKKKSVLCIINDIFETFILHVHLCHQVKTNDFLQLMSNHLLEYWSFFYDSCGQLTDIWRLSFWSRGHRKIFKFYILLQLNNGQNLGLIQR